MNIPSRPNSSEASSKPRRVKGAEVCMRDKAAVFIAAGGLLLSILAVHVNTQKDIARLSAEINNFSRSNVKTLEVLERLADSVEKLSVSVARLDERTKVLEREDAREEDRRRLEGRGSQ